jgi:Tol biopolymer transport system component
MMNNRFLLSVGAAISVAASTAVLPLGCGDGLTQPLTDRRGVLLFTRGADTASEIFVMRPDGTDRRQLTYNTFWDGSPHWSPDGRQIVFASERDSTPGQPGRRSEIYVMSASGGGVRKLTDGLHTARMPRWSPDGTRIAFDRFDPDRRRFRVYVMGRDGANPRPLTASDGDDFAPDWSPDGARLLFLSNRAPRGWWTMYVMLADGSGEQELAVDACPYNVSDPRWSPDGARIAFTCDNSWGWGIYVMQADGTDAVRLSPPNGPEAFTYDAMTVWSPDSHQLAFVSFRADALDIYVMSAVGGTATRLTGDAILDLISDWSKGR